MDFITNIFLVTMYVTSCVIFVCTVCMKHYEVLWARWPGIRKASAEKVVYGKFTSKITTVYYKFP